jgi:hypothetical protein
MKFGLSPQPSLVLIIEGDTEEYFIPKVMELLKISQYPSFIQVFNIKGVDKKFELLARYVGPPQLGNMLKGGILLTRPPTRLLVAVDAEQKFSDSNKRKNKHRDWVDGIFEAVPKEYRTERMRDDLNYIVYIETWDDVFEFAHFTDIELSQALLKNYAGSVKPSLDYLVKKVNGMRNSNESKNVGSILSKWSSQKLQENPDYVRGRKVSKIDLAIELWPVLEKKIQDAKSEGDLNEIPIARILLYAEHLAFMTHRKDVMIRY